MVQSRTPSRVLTIIQLIARILLGLVFLVSSIHKFTNPQLFALQVEAYNITGTTLSQLIALILPGIEFILAIALLFHLARPAAPLLASLFFVAFSIAIAIAWLKGLAIDCGCLGLIREQVGLVALLRNLVLFSLTMVLILPYIITKEQKAE